MKRYILVLFVVFKLINFTYSQNVTSISLPNEIPTPNAQDLGLYGIIPMNYYTGRANISVPIFNAKENDIPLEIALLYDTGGILINRIPGWTGYNWSLQCGGCITRHKQGYRNDETEIPKSDGAIQVVIPYFKAPQKLSDAYIEYENKQVGQSLSNEEKLYEEAKNAQEVVKLTVDGTHDLYDTAPDIFYFNFLGKSGQFFLGNDGEWKVLSDDNLKVEFDYENSSSYIFPFIEGFPDPHVTEKQPKTIKGFTLIDENGTKYIFGGTTDAIEYSIPFADTGYKRNTQNRARNIWSANSWYLTEVRDRFDNTIYQFHYERGHFIVQILKNFNRQAVISDRYFSFGGNELLPFNLTLNAPVYLKQIKICNGINIKFLQSDTCNIGAHDLYPQFYKENGVDLSKEASGHNGICYGYENLYHKLCSISGTNWMDQTTDFYYLQTKNESISKYHNPVVNKLNDKGLDPINSMLIVPLHTIQILDGKKVLRSYNMEYQKYPRLMLHSLIIKDSINNTVIGKYRMKYQNLDKLPADCTILATDHWGYYTGRNGTNEYFGGEVWSLLCSDVNGLGKINYNNYKSPNPVSTQYGMLSELIYPTGGKSVFKYEQNTYSKYGIPGTYDYSTQKIVRKMEDKKLDSITGGLRIKSITNYDDNNLQLSHKEYQYSDGQLYGMPQYYWIYYPSYKKGTTTINGNELISIWSSTSIVPIVNTTGTHIGYSKVIEKEQNGVTSEYHYTNFSDFGDEYYIFTLKPKGNSQTPYDVYSDKSYLRGKLYQVITKDANENPIKEQIITYDYQDDYRSYTLASNMSAISSVPRIGNSEEVGLSIPISGGIYKMYYPKVGISQSITIDYSQNGIIIKTTDFTNRNFSIKSNGMTANVYKTLSEKSTWTKQTNKTSAPTSIFATQTNYYYPGLNSDTKIAEEFQNSYYFPISKVQKYQNSVLTEEQETNYSTYCIHGLWNPLPTSVTKQIGNGKKQSVIEYLSYNQNGMLTSYKEKGHPRTRIFWDDSVFNRCVGTVSGTRCEDDIALSDKGLILDGLPIFNYKNTEAVLYKYTSMGNVSSITRGNGETEYYFYDALNRLIEVRNNRNQTIKKYKYNYINH